MPEWAGMWRSGDRQVVLIVVAKSYLVCDRPPVKSSACQSGAGSFQAHISCRFARICGLFRLLLTRAHHTKYRHNSFPV